MDIVAARSRKIPKDSFYQLAAIGVTRTSDDHILIGIRGGDVNSKRVDRFSSGMYGFPPGGSVTAKSEYKLDPITDTLGDEFYGEVAGNPNITGIHLERMKPIGVFEANKPGPTGYKFVSLIETDATLDQVLKINLESNAQLGDHIEDLAREGMTDRKSARKAAQNVLGEVGLPPDSWEHQPIMGLPNNSTYLRNHVDNQHSLHCGISAGTTLLYADWLDRQQ